MSPCIERRGALGAEALDRVAELGEAEDVALAQELAARRVDRGALLEVGEDRRQDRDEVGLLAVEHEPVACQRCRRRRELREADGAEAPRRLLQPGRRAGHADRGGADVKDLRRGLGEVDRDRHQLGAVAGAVGPGRGDEEVEQHRIAGRRGRACSRRLPGR